MKIEGTNSRIEYIDGLRGLAVLGMFLVHSPAPWGRIEVNSGAYAQLISYLSGLIAPVFMTLAGLSMFFVVARAASRQGSVTGARLRLVRRGAEIILIGYALEFAFWMMGGMRGDPLRIFKVNILQCIGAAMILAVPLIDPLRRINGKALAVSLLFVLGAQFTWRLTQPLGIAEQIWGYAAQCSGMSRFPLFPYAGWVTLGVFLGGIWPVPGAAGETHVRFTKKLFMTALIALILSDRLEWLTGYFKLEMIGVSAGKAPPVTTIHTFIFKFSMVLFFLGIAREAAPLFAPSNSWLRPLVLLGRTSLFAYVAHLLVIYSVARAGLRGKLGIPGHLLCVIMLTAVMIALCYLWDRYPPRDWMRRMKGQPVRV